MTTIKTTCDQIWDKVRERQINYYGREVTIESCTSKIDLDPEKLFLRFTGPATISFISDEVDGKTFSPGKVFHVELQDKLCVISLKNA